MLAPAAVKVAVLPLQIAAELVVAVTTGKALTVIICCVEELVHVPVEPCILYVVVDVGVNTEPLVIGEFVFNNVYVLAPDKFNVVDCPLHIVLFVAIIATVGVAFTATLTVLLFTHPLPSVPLTV